jgi:trehalose/maltose transport system substrate-binding protein
MRTLLSATALSAAVMVTGAPLAQADSVTVSIACGAVGIELELCREGAQAWAEQTGHEVDIVSTPNDATERLALYQQILAAGSGDIDVYQIDVIWPGILAGQFVDLYDYIDKDVVEAHFPAIVENNTIDGRLIGMPWFTDAGVLYYRSDLLEQHGYGPPETWQELTEIAAAIQEAERAAGNDRMWGFVFQARAYEGLTCDALEWIDSFGGGRIVEPDGTISVNNERAVEAIDLAATWIGTIAPEGVLNYAEEESRGVFQSGNAVFMRNWPYAWPLSQAEDSPIRGKVGVTALPRGGPDGQHTGVLGGWQLAVSRHSANPGVAADLARHLTGHEEQKRRAIVGGYNPTIAALYEDGEVLEANPFFGELYDTFVNAVARPSGVAGQRYNQVSSEFYNAVHGVLSGNTTAEAALADLEGRLQRVARGGRW